ncbi:MAG TPA: quinol:cytochrome C oxidoreductase [Flavobacteriales bacterium]|nr:quinol:cytochrome C oxidoreductase [Flavobacteriales bacterium]HMW96043.1 quinol:cytochrome C oxidoreductase [Flavobacteriales bacterium]HMZ48138.1 quinol:cytochrome C oxidoreductase [Flavobacteriales bacterium]HNA32540.1 quinol:cytochrome C oxidoreductase [Flavobacteriales bacterium]HNI05748.1 quinol:cytochrome C oxidoreductase [Flavobacteriales bacterium]
MNFTLSNRARTLSMALMGLGLVVAGIGFVTTRSHDAAHAGQHFWSALFLNGFFFFGISLGALFFYSLQWATETAWSVLVRRVYEGIVGFLPIGAAVIVICLLAGQFHLNHIWHWMDHRVYDPADLEHYDPIIAGKSAYLNAPFFWLRVVLFMGTFIFAANWFRKQSLKMDQLTGDDLRTQHLLTYRRSALFLVFFAVFSSVLSWDWLMSIDTHWFSTLYGWYIFAGMWCTAMVTGVIVVLYLKSKGYLPQVNNNHIHDMGKWVFATSFLWSYLWFSQFMLYWYADIPEEVAYAAVRIEHHPGLMWGMFFINFAVPMVLLMSRDAKRNPRFLIGVGTVILIGHWLNVCQLVLPGALGENFHQVGALEAGLGLFFLGLFVLIVLRTLTKAPLTVVNSPYLEESVHHSI